MNSKYRVTSLLWLLAVSLLMAGVAVAQEPRLHRRRTR